MSSSRLTITAELVRTMQREGTILLLTRDRGRAFLLTYAALTVVFVGGAVLAYRAGLHDIGVPVGAAFVVIAYPIVSIRRVRRIAGRLLRPYDVGGGVVSEVEPNRLRLRDPDTGFEIAYRTRRVRTRGATALVEVAAGRRWGLILAPSVLLDAEDVRRLTRNG